MDLADLGTFYGYFLQKVHFHNASQKLNFMQGFKSAFFEKYKNCKIEKLAKLNSIALIDNEIESSIFF